WRLSRLQLQSAPAPFWPDVFVKSKLPWSGFFKSGVFHLIAVAFLIGLSQVLSLGTRVEPKPTFDHSQVIYYQPSEYLPPQHNRSASTDPPLEADPAPARQAVISVPREADNRSQTIVTPPNVKLKKDIAMPNVVAWSDTVVKPRLAIPAAPL